MSLFDPALFGQLARFFTTALFGLFIDIAIAWSLISLAGWNDIPAAAAGLAAGMVFNYFVHLTWTFAGSDRRSSVGHFAQFAVGVTVTLAVRTAVLYAIEHWGYQAVIAPPIRLAIGAGVSFLLSFAICRYIVFAPPRRDRPFG